ncbi:SRPBCC domain-containing protein [Jidongwangia harbinensis]|uniref:SRPBCC domain-containing protein n=1 Tax=Jidongwangia harbinensis TaxID=2878561 RepID=UPI001CD96434|nr:SRPBCC domain-containing protein [Jidongwangia harbinensis]MCA2215308.1 SRPBCC domain-containing protein [Jidongwangia harbinensis]
MADHAVPWAAGVRAPAGGRGPATGRRLRRPGHGRGFADVYREMDPPRRMVQSWRRGGDDRDSRVTITLTPAGGGADLLVVHDQVDAETAEAYRAGWASCLDRPPAYLDRPATGPGAGSR